eukprot:scpid62032/ scgid12107/ 
MEMEAVKVLWKWSLEHRGLRYTTYLGDGASKGYTAVCAEKPYGDIPIAKEECTGHVQKRLGKGLRDLKQRLRSTKLANGKAIGGRGRLTDSLIDSLQNYYGMAIRNHPSDVTRVAKAIRASLCHRASSDDKLMHHFVRRGWSHGANTSRSGRGGLACTSTMMLYRRLYWMRFALCILVLLTGHF